jgi:hypothetical protein
MILKINTTNKTIHIYKNLILVGISGSNNSSFNIENIELCIEESKYNEKILSYKLKNKIDDLVIKGDRNEIVLDKTAFNENICIKNNGYNRIHLSNFFDLSVNMTIHNKKGIIVSLYKQIYCNTLTLGMASDYDNTSLIRDIIAINEFNLVYAYNGYVDCSVIKKCKVEICEDKLTGKGFKYNINYINDKDIKMPDKEPHYNQLIELYRSIFYGKNYEFYIYDKKYESIETFNNHFSKKLYSKWDLELS